MVKITPHMKAKGTEPLAIIEVNHTYILGIYQGSLSKYDLLLKYRQKDNNAKSGWSKIRTPKHIYSTRLAFRFILQKNRPTNINE